MRTKSSSQYYLSFVPESSLKIVNDYRQKYEIISTLLDNNPELLSLVHLDWSELLSTSNEGRDGHTSEQLLRALIVMFLENASYRKAIVLRQ